MYRSGPDPTKKKTADTLTSLLGINGLNKCFQGMHLDSSSSIVVDSIPSTSNLQTSSSRALETASLTTPASTFKPASHFDHGTLTDSGVGTNIEKMTVAQRQQFLANQQQQLAAAAFAKHQYAMAAAGGNYHRKILAGSQICNQQDEISKSLKMFAMLTSYSNGGEPSVFTPYLPQSSVDAVMQDFACNGYICDDLNRFQLGMHLSNNIANDNVSNGIHDAGKGVTSGLKCGTENLTLQQQHMNTFQQQNFNINFNNNFWKMLPTHMQQHSNVVTAAAAAAAAATAAAAVNIDYNSNQKKLTKRYCNSKNEKYTSAKHCVFCENNNEPEAVVKSHAVRDSLGRVLCPKLRTYVCPICKASGDMAHTVKYCPQKPIITMEDALKAESFRSSKGTFYKHKMKV